MSLLPVGAERASVRAAISCSSRLAASRGPVHLSPEGKTSETSSYLGTKGNMTITASLRKALTGPSRAGRGGKVAGPCGEGTGIIIRLYEGESPVFSYV